MLRFEGRVCHFANDRCVCVCVCVMFRCRWQGPRKVEGKAEIQEEVIQVKQRLLAVCCARQQNAARTIYSHRQPFVHFTCTAIATLRTQHWHSFVATSLS